MKKYFLVFICIVFISCHREGQSTKVTNNKNFDVELLFETDGCRVYRFWDAGNPIYFINKEGNTFYLNHVDESTKPVNVQTK
jgi:hypothetical protein